MVKNGLIQRICRTATDFYKTDRFSSACSFSNLAKAARLIINRAALISIVDINVQISLWYQMALFAMNLPVALWLLTEHLTGVWKVMSLTLVRNSDFFICPLLVTS